MTKNKELTIEDINLKFNNVEPRKTIYINVAKDFSIHPGPRLISQGDNSAELFFKEVLNAKVEQARNYSKTIVIDIDGTDGYLASFIEELSGGLVRKYKIKDPQEFIRLFRYKTNFETWILIKFINHIKKAFTKLSNQ